MQAESAAGGRPEKTRPEPRRRPGRPHASLTLLLVLGGILTAIATGFTAALLLQAAELPADVGEGERFSSPQQQTLDNAVPLLSVWMACSTLTGFFALILFAAALYISARSSAWAWLGFGINLLMLGSTTGALALAWWNT